MPVDTTKKVTAFLKIIFSDIDDKKIKKLKRRDYDNFCFVFFGNNYRTLKDYERVLRSFNILISITEITVTFSKEGYDEYMVLLEKVKDAELVLYGK